MSTDEEVRVAVLGDYAKGGNSRSTAMKRLGFTWDGELIDAMWVAGLRCEVDQVREDRLVRKLVAC